MNGCRQAQALCAWVVGPLVGLLALATPARASVFELFGGDPRGIAMAGALVAATEGAEAAFYNPAALVEAPTNGMQIGFAQTHLPMDIHLIRPVCSDDAATCRARFGRQSSRHAPLLPEGGRHFQLGWHARHLRVLGGRLAFGALLTLPSTRLVRLSGPDAAQPHFVVYESLPDRLSVLLASGIRINDRVAVGVGVQVLAALGSELDLGLDPTDPTDVDADPDGDGTSIRDEIDAGTDPFAADTPVDGGSSKISGCATAPAATAWWLVAALAGVLVWRRR